MRLPAHLHPTGRLMLRAACAAALLAVAGCGPGTGGTGDGEGNAAFAPFGAMSASVCNAGVSASLACPSGSAQAPDLQGTAMVHFSDTAGGNNIAVRIQDNHLQLVARCLNVQFEGDWGIAAQNDARFFGTYTGPAAPNPAPASLTVQSSGANGELVVLLRDVQGRLVLGPVLLQRVASPVTNPAACPA
jgi:hypothetical protein